MGADIILDGKEAEDVDRGDATLLGVLFYCVKDRKFEISVVTNIPIEEAAALVSKLIKPELKTEITHPPSK